jgi:hypothetical protein
MAAGVSGCLRSQASGQATATVEGNTLNIRLAFNETVTESDINEDMTGDRELAFMCFSVSMWNADGQRVANYDIGGDEDGIGFNGGYYAPETDPESADGTFRWFGGPEATTTFRLGGVNGASTIRNIIFVGTPVVDNQISATLSVDDQETDSVEFGTRGAPDPYEFSLEQSTA